MTVFLWTTQYLVHTTALAGAMEEALGSCKFTGRLTPLTSPWSLHLTVTILSYSYTNNFVFATSISKLNQYAFGDAHTGIKTSEEQGND